MDSTEKWGTDVETATELALQELGLTKDEVDVTILEEPSKGFFGIGAKLALVKVEKKGTKKEKAKKEDKKETKKETKKEVKEVANKTAKKETKKEKTNDKPVENATAREQIRSIIDADVPTDLKPCEDHVGLTFLKNMVKEMGLDLNITAKEGDHYLYIEIDGDGSGVVIGKRGQTLDAIQYLVSLAVNKDREDYVRVIVDAENYRRKRENTLIDLANRLAEKAVKSNRDVKLEPMNPYERKVIHSALQNHEFVTTKSEGEGSYRRVVILLK